MSYVMVPVPEEVRDQVMAVIGQLAFADALSEWDADALLQFVAELSEQEREIIDVLMEASAKNQRLSRRQVEAELEMSADDLEDSIIALNRKVATTGNPWLILVSKGEEDDGTPSSDAVYLPRKVCEIIRSAG